MQLSFKTFLIVCPMLFLAGLVDSIGGGGGLISLPAYLFADLPDVFDLRNGAVRRTLHQK